MKNNFKNIIYIYIAQFTRLLVGIGVLYFLTENLSLENFGKFSVIKSTLSVLGILISLGIENVIVRFIPEFEKNKRQGYSYFLMVNALKIRILSIGFIWIIIFFYNEQIATKFNLNSFEVLIIPLILLMIRLNSILGVSFLTALIKVYKEKKLQIVYDLSKLVGFYFIAQLDQIIYLVGFWFLLELGALCYLGLIFFNYFRKIKKETSTQISFVDKSRIFKFAKYQTLAALLFILIDLSSDNLMISYFLSNEKVAIYSFGLGLISYLSYFNPSFLMKSYYTSLLTNIYSGSVDKNIIDKINFIFRISVVIMIPLYSVFAINIEYIIDIVFDKKYNAAVDLILLGLIFYVFKELNFSFSPLINLFEKNKLFLKAGILSIFNLIVNLILIPKIGIMGALIGTGLTWTLIFGFYLYSFIKFFKSYKFFPFKTVVSSLFLGLAFILLINSIPGIKSNGILSLTFNFSWQLLLIVTLFYAFNLIRLDDIHRLYKFKSLK